MEEEQKWNEVYRRLDSLTEEIIALEGTFADLVEWCERNLPVKYVDDYIKFLKAEIRGLKKKVEESGNK